MASSSDFGPKGTVKDLTDQAKQTIDRAAENVQDAATQIGRQVGAVGGNVSKAVDKSLRDQPYTSLVLVGVFGFVLGALWKS